MGKPKFPVCRRGVGDTLFLNKKNRISWGFKRNGKTVEGGGTAVGLSLATGGLKPIKAGEIQKKFKIWRGGEARIKNFSLFSYLMLRNGGKGDVEVNRKPHEKDEKWGEIKREVVGGEAEKDT